MTKKTKNKYNHYTEDFRREAVRRSEGNPPRQLKNINNDIHFVAYKSSF